jgi:hypothetical protein
MSIAIPNSSTWTPARQSLLFGHLALGFAGLCLACAEAPFIPEMQILPFLYVFFLTFSWQHSGRWVLSTRMANLLGFLIAVAVISWIVWRIQSADVNVWIRDVPIAVAIVPYLGPMLMALLIVRLFQPRRPGDFWQLQGMGLLQVALASVLADGILFGVLLVMWVVCVLCAMEANERLHNQKIAPLATNGEPGTAAGKGLEWFQRFRLGFAFRWGVGIALLCVPLFLLTPRFEGPEWDPLSRFGVRNPQLASTRTGYGDEIDLNRTGRLEPDDAVAFRVSVTDRNLRPEKGLPLDQYWRGIVLDRYEDGVWRCDLQWPTNLAIARPLDQPYEPSPGALRLNYQVPGKLGGLVTAEPLLLGPEAGSLPLLNFAEHQTTSRLPLFFEAGGTVMSANFLPHREYTYKQLIPRLVDRDRYPAQRLRDGYLQRLLRVRVLELSFWTRDLLRRLAQAQPNSEALRQALAVDLPRQSRGPEGQGLAPEFWEPVGRLLAEHLATSGEYRYSLSTKREQTSVDPVMDFLVHVKQGPCDRFAAALALMLRSQGIPARLVRGYRGAEYLANGNYLVRQSMAHAWVELLVLAKQKEPAEPNGPLRLDWLQLDPTSSIEAVETGNSAVMLWWAQQRKAGQNLWRDLIVGYNRQQQEGVWAELLAFRAPVELWLSLAAILSLCVAWFVIRRRSRWLRQRWTIRALYERLEVVLLRVNGASEQNISKSTTPLERVNQSLQRLRERINDPQLQAVPREIVEELYRVRYGANLPNETLVRELDQRLARIEVILGSL